MLGAASSAYCKSIFDIYLAELGRDDSWFKWVIGNSFKFNICMSKSKRAICFETNEGAGAADKNPIQYKLEWTHNTFKFKKAMIRAVSEHMYLICSGNWYRVTWIQLHISGVMTKEKTWGGVRQLRSWEQTAKTEEGDKDMLPICVCIHFSAHYVSSDESMNACAGGNAYISDSIFIGVNKKLKMWTYTTYIKRILCILTIGLISL